MSSRRGFVLTAFASGLSSLAIGPSKEAAHAVSPGETQRWDPKTTWVFAIGVLVYPDGEAWPLAGRRDSVMIEELKKCGVPPSQIEFIQDKDAHWKRVIERLKKFLMKAPIQSTFWFYFAGHGEKDKEGVGSFVLYDKNWIMADLFTILEQDFKGHMALLFADCCFSGKLGLEAMLRGGRVAYGVLTSSLSSVQSTDAWTFTNCIIQGLQGVVHIKENQNGQIDFFELAAFTEREMAAHDGQLSTFVATNGFDPRMILRTGKQKAHPRLGEYVNAKRKDGKRQIGRIEEFQTGKFLIKWVGGEHLKNEWVADVDLESWSFVKYTPGTKVSIKWGEKWYPGKVLTGKLGMHLISFDGYSSTWDEWVDASRLKPVQ